MGADLAAGAGLSFGVWDVDRFQGAYLFTINNIQPREKLFLFGFSRVTYIVRTPASMLECDSDHHFHRHPLSLQRR